MDLIISQKQKDYRFDTSRIQTVVLFCEERCRINENKQKTGTRLGTGLFGADEGT